MQDGKEITKHHLTALYLGLAELYVFADSRDVGALKTRVVVDLCAAEDEAVDARFVISDIVSYVYDNTTASDSEELEGLRAFAMDFCSEFGLETLATNESLKDVIRADQGELIKDFMWMLGKKTPPSQKK